MFGMVLQPDKQGFKKAVSCGIPSGESFPENPIVAGVLESVGNLHDGYQVLPVSN
jgi:hypothetical protein